MQKNNLTEEDDPKHQGNHPIKIQTNDQRKLIEILQKASTNHGKLSNTEKSFKINNWFDLELRKNNDLLSPITKDNAFTLEDIEKN